MKSTGLCSRLHMQNDNLSLGEAPNKFPCHGEPAKLRDAELINIKGLLIFGQ